MYALLRTLRPQEGGLNNTQPEDNLTTINRLSVS